MEGREARLPERYEFRKAGQLLFLREYVYPVYYCKADKV